MPSCAVSGCKSRYQGASDIQYFSFPLKDQERCSSWVSAIGKKNWTPSKWSKICSLHFKPEDYLVRPGANRKLLNLHAIPSVFVKTESHVLPRACNKKDIHIDDEDTKNIKIEDVPIHESSDKLPRYKSYILISVDCARKNNSQIQETLRNGTMCKQNEKAVMKTNVTSKEEQLKAKIKVLNQTIRHQKTKIQKLKQILRGLKRKNLI